jgi:hypothetical protein
MGDVQLATSGTNSIVSDNPRQVVVSSANANVVADANTTIIGGPLLINASETNPSLNYTIVNNLSSQGIVNALGGNSNNWNSTFTSWNAASATSVVAFNDTRFARLSSQAYTLVNATSSIQPVRGIGNTASGNYSLVAGGQCNRATGPYSTVVGGISSLASGACSFIGGGRCNTASGGYSFIGSGQCNTASGNSSTVAGGDCNTASTIIAGFTTVGGGCCNTACGFGFSTVAGGRGNTASGVSSTVGGGQNNTACGLFSTVAGGQLNTASGNYSNVAGGRSNTASGTCSFIAGGVNNNTNSLTNTFILGSSLSATKANYTYVNNLSVQGNIESNTNYVATLSLTANQTMPSAADTVLTLNPRNDPNNWFSRTAGVGLTASRLTPNIPGFYNINYQVSWQPGVSATGAQNNIQIMKVSSGVPNTISIVQQPIANVSVNTTQNTSAITFMNGTTDYLYFQAYSSNASQVVTGTTDGNWTKVEVFKIN